jgi:DNA-binding transcriptional MerR regulator
MDDTLLKIGEIASFFGISVKAMRIYEKKGLLIPIKMDPDTGYRYYTPGQVITLNVLLALKPIGFSLGEIGDILSGRTSVHRFAELLKHKRKAWRDLAIYADGKISEIDRMAGHINDTSPSFQLAALSEEQRAWLLSKMVMIETGAAKKLLTEALWV